MCGRFTLRTEPAEFWPADQLSLFQPRYNIAPSQMVFAVRSVDGENRPATLQWGLVPSWAKDAKIGYRTINSRSETIAEKPSFRDAFRRRRCLVLADGYYEWKANGKQKQPYYIRMADQRPFSFAGLWESWLGPPGARRDEPLETCTIITTNSNELTAGVHERMPVILHHDDLAFWLDPEFQSASTLAAMLRPFESDEMTMYPVSTIVNKPANDTPECVAEIECA